MADPFVGEIQIFAGNFAPRNWAFCNGQTIPVSQNTALFSILGTTYGGDGRTTFGVPNLQGRAPMHVGTGPGLSTRRLGQKGGGTTVGLNSTNLPAHNHSLTAQNPGFGVATTAPAGNYLASPTTGGTAYGANASPVGMSASSLTNTGGTVPHNNMQPYLVMSFVVCLVGLYPSRS